MASYVKSTDFAAKDALLTGNPAKIIKGTEIDAEFNAISTAIGTKADLASPTFTGTPAAPTASPGTNTTQVATTAFVTAERTAATTLTNKTISVDDNTISGVAASSFVVSNSSGNIDGAASQKEIPSGVVVGTTDTQTLTNKTIDLGSNTVSGTKSQFNTAVTDTDIAFLNDFTGSNQSLTTSGYQKLPGGLIIQWGRTLDAGTSTSVTFPIAFPTAAVSVTANTNATSANFQAIVISNLTTTGFTAIWDSASPAFYWIAIGY